MEERIKECCATGNPALSLAGGKAQSLRRCLSQSPALSHPPTDANPSATFG